MITTTKIITIIIKVKKKNVRRKTFSENLSQHKHLMQLQATPAI